MSELQVAGIVGLSVLGVMTLWMFRDMHFARVILVALLSLFVLVVVVMFTLMAFGVLGWPGNGTATRPGPQTARQEQLSMVR